MAQSEPEPPVKDKKHRKRMKAIYKRIQDQMEFYFSDANLHRDRFLKKEITQSTDGYISLSTFISFNRIRAITEEVDVISKAIKKSTMLQMHEDGQQVKRITPILEPQNIDDKTVYVECLPLSVDHDWIEKVFAECGKINYISLPRYKSTMDPKGFAFIEFDTEAAASKACEIMNNPPVQAGDKPGKFPKTSKTMSQLKRKLEFVDDSEYPDPKAVKETEKQESTVTDASKITSNRQEHTPQKSRKHQPSGSSVSESDESPISKKRRIVGEDNKKHGKSTTEGSAEQGNQSSAVSDGQKTNEKAGTKKRKRSQGKSKDDTDGSQESPVKSRKKETEPDARLKADQTQSENGKKVDKKSQEVTDSKSMRKKRKKTGRAKDKDIPELRVLPKKEWLSLRREYISLQRASMAALKKTLKEVNQDVGETVDRVGDAVGKDDKLSTNKKESSAQLEFIPNVIVKLSATEPVTRKQLKERLCGVADIAYTDLKDGADSGYLRCTDTEGAKKISTAKIDGHTFSLLSGDEEKEYWEKLAKDREAKRNSKHRPKRRGQNKLLDRAQKVSADVIQRKHVIFDD